MLVHRLIFKLAGKVGEKALNIWLILGASPAIVAPLTLLSLFLRPFQYLKRKRKR